MSLQNILKPGTINEEWSELWAYAVNATQFRGGGIPKIIKNKYDVSKFSMETGTGTLGLPYNVEIDFDGSHFSLNGSLRIAGVTGILNGSTTIFAVKLNIDPLVVTYPGPGLDQPLSGACSSTLYTPANRYISNVVSTIPTPNEILFIITGLGNFTGADPTRILDIQFSAQYSI